LVRREGTLAFRAATTRAPHRPTKEESSHNVTTNLRGNSRAYTLDRLKREAPALYPGILANIGTTGDVDRVADHAYRLGVAMLHVKDRDEEAERRRRTAAYAAIDATCDDDQPF